MQKAPEIVAKRGFLRSLVQKIAIAVLATGIGSGVGGCNNAREFGENEVAGACDGIKGYSNRDVLMVRKNALLQCNRIMGTREKRIDCADGVDAKIQECLGYPRAELFDPRDPGSFLSRENSANCPPSRGEFSGLGSGTAY